MKKTYIKPSVTKSATLERVTSATSLTVWGAVRGTGEASGGSIWQTAALTDGCVSSPIARQTGAMLPGVMLPGKTGVPARVLPETHGCPS